MSVNNYIFQDQLNFKEKNKKLKPKKAIKLTEKVNKSKKNKKQITV